MWLLRPGPDSNRAAGLHSRYGEYKNVAPDGCSSSPAAGLTCRYRCLLRPGVGVVFSVVLRAPLHAPAVGRGRAGAWHGSNCSPFARIAHRMRACLLAMATSVFW